jgi:hypothetical protein
LGLSAIFCQFLNVLRLTKKTLVGKPINNLFVFHSPKYRLWNP